MEQKSFTRGLNFYKLFWVFVFGSIVGTLYETILAFLKTGAWVWSQGVLYGPFNQVYGLGAILFMISIYQLNNLWVVFGVGTILGGLFEYISSFLQELIFHSTSWNYANHFLNFQGRTSILVAIGWGLLGVVFVKWIAPFLNKMINSIPNYPGKLITWIVFFSFYVTFV